MPDSFNITEVQDSGSAVVVRVKGQLDVKSTPALIECGQEIRRRGKSMILNLAEVSFIASNGVGGLLSLVEDFKGSGLSIRLASLSLAVESVLKLLNLDQYLDIDPNENAAVTAIEG